jgi:hypothetical protein
MSRFTEAYKRDTLAKYWSHVDYKPGDWVETCNLLPGIVQSIDIRYDERGDYFHDDVSIFYPHMAFREDIKGQYSGESNCSVCSCGVHKIDAEYACKLMALGEERLKALWEKMSEDFKDTDEVPSWSDYVEKEYESVFGKK